MSRWINLLALLPNTTLTLLIIGIAFLRFYDETDFLILGQLTNTRLWSNRLTLAAFLVAVVHLGVVEQSSCAAWNRRISLTTGFANEKQIASMKQSSAAARMRPEERQKELRMRDEEEKIEHEQQLAELKRQNARLAELESKLNTILHS